MEGGVQVPEPSGSLRGSGGLGRWRPRFFRRRPWRRDLSGTGSRFSLRSSHSSHALFPDEVYENNGSYGRPMQMRKTLSGLSSGFLLLDRSSSKHAVVSEEIPLPTSSPTTSSTVTDAPIEATRSSPCDTATASLADGDSQNRRSFRRTKGTLNLHDYKPDNTRNNNNHNRQNRTHANLGHFPRTASTANTDTGDDNTSTLAPRPSFRKVLSGVLGRLR